MTTGSDATTCRRRRCSGCPSLPTIAYKVTDKLSLGASLNAMYGIYKNQVAINNVDPPSATASSSSTTTPGAGAATSASSYEFDRRAPGFGLTWNSQVNLDFSAPAQFSNLAPGLNTLLSNRGLLNANIECRHQCPAAGDGQYLLAD